MEYDKKYISKLLKLYEEGASSIEQEKELKDYFSSGNYDQEFEVYAPLFEYFERESAIEYEGEIQPTPKKTKFFWINIAASICILIGAFWYFKYNSNQQELKEARIAFENTQKALNLLSINMNEGLEKLEYVEVFSQEKNKLIK